MYGPMFAGVPFDLEALKVSLAGEKAGYFTTLNSILEKNNGWLTGKPSAADVLHWVNLYHLSLSKHPKGSNNVLRIYDFQEFPAIRKWMTTMEAKWFSEEEWTAVRGFVAYGSSVAPGINLIDQE
jgi:glutathione S-transferase